MSQNLRLLGTIVLLLLALSGCKRGSVDARNTTLLPGVGQPVGISSGDANAGEPAIATSAQGDVYVAWVSHGPKTAADVMLARFDGDGRMQGSAVRVNTTPGIATAWRGDPPTVAVAPEGTVYVGWTARVETESGHATDFFMSSSRDRGQTFGAAVKVNDDAKPAGHGMHSLAVGKDGHVYVAWLDERNISPVPMKDMKMDAKTKGHHIESNSELFFASSTDGGRTFSHNQRVATDTCPCCKTAVAVSSDGQVYLSWRQVLPGDLRHIAFASSADQGKTFTAPKIVSDDQWVIAGCPVSGPSLSVDNNGTLGILWYSAGKNGQTGLYWSQSNDHGATFAARKLLAPGQTKGTPVLITQNGVITSVWTGDEGGKSRVLAANVPDSTNANNFLVAAGGELPAAALIQNRMMIAYIAMDRREVLLVIAPRAGL